MLRRVIMSVLLAVGIAGKAAKADPLLYLSSYLDNNIYSVQSDGAKSLYLPNMGGGGPMAFDGAGNLYEANYDTGTVFKITPSKVVSTYASGFQNPYGLAFDPAGNLYVSNSGNGSGSTISKVTPQQQVISNFATGLHQPLDLAYGPDGFLYVANGSNGTVSKVASDGSWTTYVSGLSAGALTLDAQGDLFVQNEVGSHTSVILKVDSSLAKTQFATGFADINAMKFASDGNLYVTSDISGSFIANGTIMRVGPGGGAATPFITGLTSPTGLLAVPEPTSLGLLGVTSAALLIRRRRSSAAKA